MKHAVDRFSFALYVHVCGEREGRRNREDPPPPSSLHGKNSSLYLLLSLAQAFPFNSEERAHGKIPCVENNGALGKKDDKKPPLDA